MCKDCNKTLFGRRDFAEEVAQRPADDRAYETLVEFEKGIRLMLPKFQRLLLALQYVDQAFTLLGANGTSGTQMRHLPLHN